LSDADDYVDFDPEVLGSDLCTVVRAVSGHGRFIRQREGNHTFGDIKVTVAPYSGSRCYRLRWKASPESLPKPFMKGAGFEGIKEALLRPLSDGRQIAFVEVAVVDGAFHDLDTDELAVKIAASMVDLWNGGPAHPQKDVLRQVTGRFDLADGPQEVPEEPGFVGDEQRRWVDRHASLPSKNAEQG
jgi:hypothetical protein